MVYFTCNYCGESLKKNAVDKHCISVCRRPKNLTCLDCMKDFNEGTYNLHTRCITEDEKYSAKSSSSEQTFQKGEVKQLAWLDVIKYAYDNLSEPSPNHKAFLKHLIKHPNVPQKKQKFMKFVQNVGFHVQHATAEAVWQLLWNIHTNRQKEKCSLINSSSQTDGSLKFGGSAPVATCTTPDDDSEESNGGHGKRKASDNETTSQVSSSSVPPCAKRLKVGKSVHFLGVSDNNKVVIDAITRMFGPALENNANDTRQDGNEVPVAQRNGLALDPRNKFKWMKAIRQELINSRHCALTVQRLKKGVLRRYRDFGGCIDAAAKMKFDRKLEKSRDVIVHQGIAVFHYIPEPATS